MIKILDKIEAALSSKKGKIICGVIAVAVIGGLAFQSIQETQETEKAAAIQQDKEDAQIQKKRDAYVKKKADAAAKVIADAKAAADAVAAEREASITRGGRRISTVYREVHTMANSIVIANDVWGQKAITKENISALSDEIQEEDYESDVKTQLLAILNRWNTGNFSQADEDHNYVWEKLGGSTGRATGVDTSKLPSWAK
ncbi:MAG: DUF6241 domain-containing protein [Clostridium sp.]